MLVEVVLLAVLVFLVYQVLKKPANYPPGQWGLPLVGYLPLPGPTFEDNLRQLHKKHGSVYLWRMGVQTMVFVHDYRVLREAFNRVEFTDRPDWELFKFNEKVALGVVSSNGAIWNNNRRLTLRLLRDMGMGKSKLVEAVHTQAAWVAGVLAKQANKPAPISHALKVAIVNVIWQLVGGKQFEIDNPKLLEFEKLSKLILEAESRIAVQDFLPWLRYLMPSFLFKKLIRQDAMDLIMKKFTEYFYEEIAEHRETMSPGSPRDLIDGYLMEMDKKKDDPENTYSKLDLALLLIDLFFAGSETTTFTLTWMFYYLAANPSIQHKLQAEIDSVLPDGTQATLEDKPNLPYTEAVIHETLRMSALVPLSLQHVASNDTTLNGYFIPKGAVLNGTTFSIHYDTQYWDTPEKFLPERWLNEEGKFVTKKEGFVPFGIGKRQCLGESLARMELLIFTTTIFQRLSFAGLPGKTVNLKPDSSNPLVHIPPTQDLLISVRAKQ